MANLKTAISTFTASLTALVLRRSSPIMLGGWFANRYASATLSSHLDRFFGISYACIEQRAEARAGLEWKAYIRDAKEQGGKKEAGADHWLSALMENPNPALPWLTWEDIQKAIEHWQSVAGAAFLWMPKDGKRVPQSIWIIPPALVTMIPSTRIDRIVGGYEVWTPGGAMPVPYDEMCFLPLMAPSSSLEGQWLRGQSRIGKALADIDVGYYVREHLTNHFKNGAIPPLFMESQDVVRPADRKSFMKEFLEEHQGVNNVWKPIYLPGNTKAIVADVTGNLRNLSEMTEKIDRRVAVIFRVPWGILTGEYDAAAPAASFKGQWHTLQRAIDPDAKRSAKVLTRFLQLSDPNVIIGYEPIEWSDPTEVRLDEVHRLDNGQATINDLRRERGLEESPEPIANMLLLRPDLIAAYTALQPKKEPEPNQPPGGQLLPSNAIVEQSQGEVPDQIEEAIAKAIATRSMRSLLTDTTRTDSVRAALWLRKDDTRAEYAALLKRTIQRELRGLEKEILGNVRSIGVAAYTRDDDRKDPFDTDAAKKAWEKATADDRAKLVDWSMRDAANAVDKDWDELQSEFDKQVQRAVDKSSSLIKEPVDTIHREMQELLRKMKDKPTDDVAKAIRSAFETYSESRADLIAQTTAAVTINASQKEAWQEMGFKRSWLTRRDKRVRGAHKIDGQVEDEDGQFTQADGTKAEYPNQPRERCYTLPDVAQTNPQAG